MENQVRPNITHSPTHASDRYALNFKGLPFKTEWTEYPDIANLAKLLGAKPTGTKFGQPWYTLPIIHDDTTGVVLSESIHIAEYLDQTYPDTPRLMPDGTFSLHTALVAAIRAILPTTLALRNAILTAKYLNPQSREYYIRTREKMYARPFEQWTMTDEQVKVGIEQLEAALDNVSTWYKNESPFFGNQLGFADMILAGYLRWCLGLWGQDSEEWKKIAGCSGGRWGRLIESLNAHE